MDADRYLQLEPKRELEFDTCFGNFECARLDVPLDWNFTESERTISIALSRLPARVPVTDPKYGGVIVINPGILGSFPLRPNCFGTDICEFT